PGPRADWFGPGIPLLPENSHCAGKISLTTCAHLPHPPECKRPWADSLKFAVNANKETCPRREKHRCQNTSPAGAQIALARRLFPAGYLTEHRESGPPFLWQLCSPLLFSRRMTLSP